MALFLCYCEERPVKQNNAPALKKKVFVRAVLCVAGTSCRAALSQFLLCLQVYEKGSGLSKFCLSMSTDSSVQVCALGFLLYIQCRSWGQQQWLFCCITQAQSGMSGVSSWVRRQNSSVRQNLLIATVLLSRGFVGLCAFNDNFFSPGS